MAKLLTGKVVSTKMEKTIVVEVERVFRHPVYKKTMKSHKKHKAHNENMKIELGDIVEIKETRPISKDKHFIVVNKLK
jgi:small subunit ribosomal protein S17